jgi:BCD family chlorophyll transporter-like MFS transporter
MKTSMLGWTGIFRLGLVQTALGAIVVLTTSTLNRVMVVELALPAVLPGALVGFHYAVQLLRPRWGHGSDLGGRCTPWILGGIAVLAAGGVLAALATALMAGTLAWGIALAVVAFAMIGAGVGAAGTTLLVLLAKRVEPARRAAAATIVWVMMIAGFVVTTIVAGGYLDPYSHTRLVTVATVVAISAFAVALIALWGVERGVVPPPRQAVSEQTAFRTALAQVWSESQSRRFAVFVLISMLAYSAQDLILEPYAGLVFGYTPGESTRLSGIQHAGVLTGMIVVALALSGIGERRAGSMRFWVVGGCLASAVALLGIVAAGFVGADWPLRESVFFLGLANGVFAVAAIGSMMGLADSGRKSREGVRMGIWGAAQAIAFGGGGFLGALSVDVLRQWTGTAFPAYAWVFAGEAVMFMAAAWLACGLAGRERNDSGAWLRNRSGEPASIGGG